MGARTLLLGTRPLGLDERPKFRHEGFWLIPATISFAAKVATIALGVCIMVVGVEQKVGPPQQFQFYEGLLLAVAATAVCSSILEFVATKSLLFFLFYLTDICILCGIDALLFAYPVYVHALLF